MTSRIDIIGQNGNDGEHYIVEEVAGLIEDHVEFSSHAERISAAIKIIEYFNYINDVS